MKIGDHVHIGTNTVVEAAQIGNHVEIGKNCIIVRVQSFSTPAWLAITSATNETLWQGKFTIIKDCARIADNTVLLPNTVIPAQTLFAGYPGKSSRNLSKSSKDTLFRYIRR